MSYCSDYISRKLKVLSFFAMVTVVFIHSDPLSLFSNQSALMIHFSRMKGLLQYWAVPYLFMVSGFFFSRYLDSVQNFDYRHFVKSKLRSLGIPYLLWGGVYGVALTVPLSIMVNRSRGLPMLDNTVFCPPIDLFSVLNGAFGIFNSAPANGALWFVRMLLVFFLLSPLWLLLQRKWRITLPLLGMALLLTCNHSGIKHDAIVLPLGLSFCIKYMAIGYQLLGMAISVFKLESKQLPKCVFVGLLACCLAFVVFYHGGVPLMEKVFTLCLVLVIWQLYDYLPRLLGDKLPWIFSLSFWIYCMHHPITHWFGAVYRAILGRSGAIAYFAEIMLVPFSTLVVCILVALAVKRTFPWLFNILNGGR